MSFWTDDKITALRQCVADRLSVRQAGITLGCTKNAAVGKAHRLGLRFDGGPGPHRGPANAKTPASTRRAKPAPKQPRPVQTGPRVYTPPTVHPLAQYDQATVQTKDLEPHHCRWPVGEPGAEGFGHCGAQIVPDRPYCGPHCARAYAPLPARSPKNGNELARSLRRYAA